MMNTPVILMAPTRRNPDFKQRIKEMLESFQVQFQRFRRPYKIVIGSSIEEISRKNEYASLIRSIFRRMPENSIHRVGPDDISSLTGSAIGSKMAEFGKNFYQNGEKRKVKPKATLLDFWATWCGPCRQTLPILENLYNKLGNQGLEVIGIADEPLSTLNAFYERQHRSPYPLYRDATKDFWRRYGIRAVPTLMLLDGEGYIKGVWSGVPNAKALEQVVRETMEGK